MKWRKFCFSVTCPVAAQRELMISKSQLSACQQHHQQDFYVFIYFSIKEAETGNLTATFGKNFVKLEKLLHISNQVLLEIKSDS